MRLCQLGLQESPEWNSRKQEQTPDLYFAFGLGIEPFLLDPRGGFNGLSNTPNQNVLENPKGKSFKKQMHLYNFHFCF